MSTAKDNEIERLRTAMVFAMADCENEAGLVASSLTRKNLLAIASILRTALEKR